MLCSYRVARELLGRTTNNMILNSSFIRKETFLRINSLATYSKEAANNETIPHGA